MKKILITLSTFSLGLFAFYLLDFKQIPASSPKPIQYETPLFIIDSSPKPEIKNFKPFFNSFKDDEGYYGWLIADDFKGMKEVWTIRLSRNSEKSKNEKLDWSAMILTSNPDDTPNDDADFSSVWIKTENNRLSFKTNKYHGTEYKFKGEFYKTGNQFVESEKVLKGTLQKFVKGKKVAEFTDDFTYFEPHCFH